MVTPEQNALRETAATAGAERSRPSLGRIWSALGTVPDPEIPAVSVVDLGIVREVFWDVADPTLLVVRITPTYSGCPAIELIGAQVREALENLGTAAVRIETVLTPAWSTAAITPEGERKLREYGIAPPGSALAPGANVSVIDVRGLAPLRRPAAVVPCPRCGSTETQLVSAFGSTACKAQYRCPQCGEPFDYFKALA